MKKFYVRALVGVLIKWSALEIFKQDEALITVKKTGNAEYSEKRTRRWEEEWTQTQEKNLCEDGNKQERLREQQSQHGDGQTVRK